VNRREQVQSEAGPVLQRWQSSRELSTIRRRLGGIFGAGVVVIAAEILLDPGGLTGGLISLWFLLSVPVAAIAACLLVLLKDPANAPELWWENGTLTTAGLVLLAGFSRGARKTELGRIAWQLFFGTDGPPGADYELGTENTEIDLSAVAQFRRYVYYAIVGSVGLILAEQLLRGDRSAGGGFEGLLGFDLGPAGWAAVFLAALILGFVVGGLAAAMDP